MIGRPILRVGRPSLLQPAARTAPVPRASPSPAAPPTSAASGGSTNGLIDQLRELGRLRDQGVLTEEEFATQKARLLNQ